MSLRRQMRWPITEVVPPILLSRMKRGLNRRRGLPAETLYRPVPEKKYPASEGAEIVRQARQNLERALAIPQPEGMPRPSNRWSYYIEKVRERISAFETPRDVIDHAQSTQGGFESRFEAIDELASFAYYDRTLKDEFPHFANNIEGFSESPYSTASTLAADGRRLVSNIYFYQIRYSLQCLTYVQEPRVVCEIGGGTGAPARYWLTNPIHRPSCYVIVDLPTSLLSSEVFLRVNFDGLKLRYVDSPEPLAPDTTDQFTVILCPVQCVAALAPLTFDLVVNTGSMQEMPDEWIDYWMAWLDRQSCRYFYSHNYFGLALDFMAEGRTRLGGPVAQDRPCASAVHVPARLRRRARGEGWAERPSHHRSACRSFRVDSATLSRRPDVAGSARRRSVERIGRPSLGTAQSLHF